MPAPSFRVSWSRQLRRIIVVWSGNSNFVDRFSCSVHCSMPQATTTTTTVAHSSTQTSTTLRLGPQTANYICRCLSEFFQTMLVCVCVCFHAMTPGIQAHGKTASRRCTGNGILQRSDAGQPSRRGVSSAKGI